MTAEILAGIVAWLWFVVGIARFISYGQRAP
jgi:hypothetical protein